ncbi:hypothetical protein AGMMS50276_10830 [Synergistales bacterium]|nr:hypothetical protein AGMMS50276_10830 [Synergistales bacterium]
MRKFFSVLLVLALVVLIGVSTGFAKEVTGNITQYERVAFNKFMPTGLWDADTGKYLLPLEIGGFQALQKLSAHYDIYVYNTLSGLPDVYYTVKYKYEIGDESVVAISDGKDTDYGASFPTLVLTPVKPGKATVTYTATVTNVNYESRKGTNYEGSRYNEIQETFTHTETVEIVVAGETQDESFTVSIAPSSKTIKVGEEATLTASITQNGVEVPAGQYSAFEWKDEDFVSSPVTLTTSGVKLASCTILGQKAGSGKVIASAKVGDTTYSGSCNVTVTASDTEAALSISPSSASIQVGGTVTLTPNVTPAGTELTGSYNWKYEGTSGAVTLDASAPGSSLYVKGLKAGSGSINVTVSTAAGKQLSASVPITVTSSSGGGSSGGGGGGGCSTGAFGLAAFALSALVVARKK